MTPNQSTFASHHRKLGLLDRLNEGASRVENLISHSAIALINRIAIAEIFFMSGRTKVDGFLHITDTTYTLFRDEYKLPIVPYEWAAHLATYAEHLFPLLLIVGVFTRLSATALLVMTATIQLFVYPDAWVTHLSWAGLLIYLIAKGGGIFSVDRVLGIR